MKKENKKLFSTIIYTLFAYTVSEIKLLDLLYTEKIIDALFTIIPIFLLLLYYVISIIYFIKINKIKESTILYSLLIYFMGKRLYFLIIQSYVILYK